MQAFGALGDIHGDFDSARQVMERHPDIPFWLCVGDVADDEGRYEALPARLYWIKGNNENFDAIVNGAFPANLHFLPNARLETIDGLRAAGLGGTFAPTWYETPAAGLPYPGMVYPGQQGPRSSAARGMRKREPPSTGGGAERDTHAPGAPRARAVRDDKRRHFVREEVDACKLLRDVDVFLTHEAPRPFKVGRIEAGKSAVNEVLEAMKPKLHLFGHHHRFSEQERQGVRSVGMDLVSKSYLLINATTLEYELRS